MNFLKTVIDKYPECHRLLETWWERAGWRGRTGPKIWLSGRAMSGMCKVLGLISSIAKSSKYKEKEKRDKQTGRQA